MWSYDVVLAVVAALAGAIYYLRSIFAGTRYYHLGIFLHLRIAIVTNGDSGIGLQTVLELAKRGAHVYITSGNLQRAEIARKFVTERTRNRNVFARELNMASLASVRQFVSGFLREQSHLHILVNNAEIFLAEHGFSTDGYELHLAVNHLAPYLLTNLLLPTIRATPESTRIVNVGSSLHRFGELRQEDLQFRHGRPYTRLAAYAQSKLAVMLFTRQLAHILRDEQTTVNTVHPGFVRSQVMRRYLGDLVYWLVWFFLKTERSGAQTSLCVSLDPEFKRMSGRYLCECAVVEDSLLVEAARNDAMAGWLWRESDRLTSVGVFEADDIRPADVKS